MPINEKLQSSILFVFGSARGGTTYLNDLLFKWFDFSMGPEGTFILPLYRQLSRFGDLSDPESRHQLAKKISKSQMLEIIRKRYPHELQIDIKPNDILSRTLEPTYAGMIMATFACLAESWNKQRIGIKNPGFWKDLETLHHLFGDKAKYISIIRDGRDVFLSLQTVPWGKQSAYIAAKEWAKMAEETYSFKKTLGNSCLLLLTYEELLQSPADTIASIEYFLGLPLDDDSRSAFLKEANENPLRSNYSKWRKKMSPSDKYVFEAIAGAQLRALGYETEFKNPALSWHRKLAFQIWEWLRLIWINIYHMRYRLPKASKKKR
ncbi:MAG: sulfotransferase [Rhodospirillaceae bacterium]|nr:sulfotransferase [Rhodospirillaceae bacterium]